MTFVESSVQGQNFFCMYIRTLKSPIEEHARLDFSDFLSNLLAIFHVINKKFHPARLSTYLVKKQAEWNFFLTLLVYSGLLFRVAKVWIL